MPGCPKLVRYVDVQEEETKYQRHCVYGIRDGGVILQSTQFVSSISHSSHELSSGDNEPPDFMSLWDEPLPSLNIDQTVQLELPLADQLPSSQKSKKKWTPGDNPLLLWLVEHSTYLDEMIQLEGLETKQPALYVIAEARTCPFTGAGTVLG
ncbi:hypothetical protein CY34DRAFT_14788 [Suillus luteus UH-Slu-Lm8-n1]|uniref:Uncharacterized protein n=1 Tax=Suillus luteus UH-Slu-Lm8-n1 TaxID=930992 RepID=A0A0C9ZML6_9AGAM|nr:hypothetical protein CY34DRAFT_14788 [Suillus luteus UH-Slu-Lm8-n1]